MKIDLIAIVIIDATIASLAGHRRYSGWSPQWTAARGSSTFIIAMKRGTPRKRLDKDYFNDFDFVAVRTAPR